MHNGIDLLDLEGYDMRKYGLQVALQLWTPHEMETKYICDGEKGKSETREAFSSQVDQEKIKKLKGNLI